MRIAAIPDTHFPFEDHIKLLNGIKLIRQFRPDVIVQLGDLLDFFSFSKYPRDPSAIQFTPKSQFYQGIARAKQMWSRLRKQNKNARLIQLSDANHDQRLIKRLEQRAPQIAFIGKSWLESQFQFDGVELRKSHIIVDGVMIEHGNKKPGEHAKFNQMNTLTGHTHKARIEYFANINGPYWEFNAGYLGDKSSPVFSYRGHNRLDDTHVGIGLIEDRQPRFVAL